ncbi:MAG: hypothetical protein RLZZ52_1289 [Actinomycetota bacterium]
MSAPATPTPDFALTGSIGKLKRAKVPQRMRNVELVLLLVACGINVGSLVLVQLGVLGAVDGGPLAICALLTVLVLAIHIAMRFVAPQADALILPVATVLNGLGIAEIYRIDLALGNEGWDALANKQIAWTALALGAAFATIVLIRHQRVLQRYTYIFGLVAVILGSPSSLVRLPKLRWPFSSPGILFNAAKASLWWARVSSVCAFPGAVTWGPSWWSGLCRCRSLCSSET